MKSTKGITLIALIITIIILLILAIVTINILINQGIIGHAQNAVSTYDEKQAQEDMALILSEYSMDRFASGAGGLVEYLENYSKEPAPENVIDAGDKIICELNGYEMEIDKNTKEVTVLGKAGPHPIVTAVRILDSNGNEAADYSLSDTAKIQLTVVCPEGVTVTNIKDEAGKTTLTANGSVYTYDKVTNNGNYKFQINWKLNGTAQEVRLYTAKVSNKYTMIGQYVNYTPTGIKGEDGNYITTYTKNNQDIDITSDKYKIEQWQIFEYDDESKKVKSIIGMPTSYSIKAVTSYSGDGQGYNISVNILNESCALYSNDRLSGVGRSIKIEDFESKFNENGNNLKNNFTNSDGIKYGDVKTYTGDNTRYPKLYEAENGIGINDENTDENHQYPRNTDGIGRSENNPDTTKYRGVVTAKNNNKVLTVTQTRYNINRTEDCFTNKKYNDIFYVKRGYYEVPFCIASRAVDCHNNSASACMGYWSGSGFGFFPLLSSTPSGGNQYYYALRPVVEFKDGISLGSGNGTADNPYQLVK